MCSKLEGTMSPRKPVKKENEDNQAGQPERLPALPERARALTAAEFRHLADVPPAVEWFANIQNPRTRRAYQFDLQDFMTFAGIQKPDEFRIVARAHVIAWRKTLEQRNQSPATIRRKLSALSAL
jgi:hypothetical protein